LNKSENEAGPEKTKRMAVAIADDLTVEDPKPESVQIVSHPLL
jgi:hypothetical protein